MTKTIIIAERDNIACVLEDKKVSEFFVHKGDVLLNDVFLSKVENILPSIDAAFVDVGIGKMGFLHAEDIIGKGTLKEKTSPNAKIMVQVIKEPTGHKGPRVTTSISLPGRFLVLMPFETGVNVSKKIESSQERARLKSIVSRMKPVGVGVIIRTEAQDQSETDIQDDLNILLEKWNDIIIAAENNEAPSLLYRDQDLLYRVIREVCTEDVDEIIVDTSFAQNRANQLLQNWNMDKNIQITQYKGKEPLLINKGIDKEIKAALQTKVNLKSGGYLFIQSTEALTVIDVNSGKFTSSATQDETIFKTNIESVHEIARQLKLRNIGGIIVVDFIDMTSRSDKVKILEELELVLQNDKAKPQVGQLSDFGLVELTRHRQGQSLLEMFTNKCSNCGGSGHVLKEMKFADPNLNIAENPYQSKFSRVKFPKNSTNKQNKKRNQKEDNNNNNNNKNNQNINNNLTHIKNETNIISAKTQEIIPTEIVSIQNSEIQNLNNENEMINIQNNTLENKELQKEILNTNTKTKTKKTTKKRSSKKETNPEDIIEEKIINKDVKIEEETTSKPKKIRKPRKTKKEQNQTQVQSQLVEG